MELIGHHGTNASYAESIIREGFRLVDRKTQWLGQGVYFFLKDGIADSVNSASEWANTRAYDRDNQCYKYARCVMEARVVSECVLDLRDHDQLKYFNLLRNFVYRTHDKYFASSDRDAHDNILLSFAVKKLKKEVVICNLYIQTTYQKIKKIQSRIPNTSVMCVCDTNKIDKASIKVALEDDTP